jgi:hypothetical protein
MANVAPLETVLNSQFLLVDPFQTFASLTAHTKSLDFCDDIEVLLLSDLLAATPADAASATLLAKVSSVSTVSDVLHVRRCFHVPFLGIFVSAFRTSCNGDTGDDVYSPPTTKPGKLDSLSSFDMVGYIFVFE